VTLFFKKKSWNELINKASSNTDLIYVRDKTYKKLAIIDLEKAFE